MEKQTLEPHTSHPKNVELTRRLYSDMIQRVTVPYVDEPEGIIVYHPSILRYALLSGVIGAIILGWMGWALATGVILLPGFGPLAAAGPGPAAFATGGIGGALGGLIGGMVALFRLPSLRR